MGTLLKFAGRLLVALSLLAVAQFGSICALPEGGQVASAKGILSQERINEFCGFWEDSGTKVVRINVTTAEEGWFGLEVSWRRNSHQVDIWTMTARPVSKDTLEYADCSHYLLTYGDKYIESEEVLYQNGTGRVSLVGKDTLTWQDDQEHKGDGLLFVPLSSPLGGGL